MQPMSTQPVIHDQQTQRFFLDLEGHTAELQYRRSGQTLDFYRTFVPESLRGKGLAEQLCKAAFEYAKAGNFKVIPSCSYVSSTYLKRHPQYAALAQ